MGRVSHQAPWGAKAFDELKDLVQESPVDVDGIEYLLTKCVIPPAKLIEITQLALVEDNLNLHMLFDKVPAKDMLLRVNNQAHVLLLKEQVERRAATPHVDHLLKLHEGGEFNLFKWLTGFADQTTVLNALWYILQQREDWGWEEDADEDEAGLGWILFLIHAYLFRYKGPEAIDDMCEAIADNRGPKALTRYVVDARRGGPA
jgi:hypothetical protein